MTPETLIPGQTSLAQLERIYRAEAASTLHSSARAGVEAAAAQIAAAAAGTIAVYGVNTGFGKLASLKIAPQDTATLQKNLILSHCCGVGEAMPRAPQIRIDVHEDDAGYTVKAELPGVSKPRTSSFNGGTQLGSSA